MIYDDVMIMVFYDIMVMVFYNIVIMVFDDIMIFHTYDLWWYCLSKMAFFHTSNYQRLFSFPLVIQQVAIEHGHRNSWFTLIYPLNIVIFLWLC